MAIKDDNQPRSFAFVLTIKDATVPLENYQYGLPEGASIGYLEALSGDVDMCNSGEISLDEFVGGLTSSGGDWVLQLIGVTHPDGEVETTSIARLLSGEYDA